MNNLSITERFIDVEEACEYLCVKKSWLYQNHKHKQIPAYKISRKLLFKTRELDRWMKENSQLLGFTPLQN